MKNEELRIQELNEQNMEQVAGGADNSKHRYIKDRKGRTIGEATWDGYWSIVYWRCPKCGKPMHLGTLNWYYCDPCDYKKFHMPYYIWTLGEDKLIEAAN